MNIIERLLALDYLIEKYARGLSNVLLFIVRYCETGSVVHLMRHFLDGKIHSMKSSVTSRMRLDYISLPCL